jgi:heterodisulfide reductase subunit A-like polyferredoxin
MKDFIRLKIEMLKDGYSLEQIKKECWQYALKEGIGVLTIDATIQLAMEIYASVIKEYHKPFGSGGTTSEQLQPLFKKLSDLGVIALQTEMMELIDVVQDITNQKFSTNG